MNKRFVAAFFFGGFHAASVYLLTGYSVANWRFWVLMAGAVLMQSLQLPMFDSRK